MTIVRIPPTLREQTGGQRDVAAEGETVRDRFVVSGIANSFEATVPWEVRQGSRVVAKGFATADGWMDKLYPWETTISTTSLEPGYYTFVARTDSSSNPCSTTPPVPLTDDNSAPFHCRSTPL